MEPPADVVYAEEVNYWKTSRTGSDEWLDKAKREIRSIGGEIVGVGQVEDHRTMTCAFAIAFEIMGESYQIKWPVLTSRDGNIKAARIQAATALYHDVKTSCVRVKFVGARASFLSWLVLPSGQTAAEATTPSLVSALPKLLVSKG